MGKLPNTARRLLALSVLLGMAILGGALWLLHQHHLDQARERAGQEADTVVTGLADELSQRTRALGDTLERLAGDVQVDEALADGEIQPAAWTGERVLLVPRGRERDQGLSYLLQDLVLRLQDSDGDTRVTARGGERPALLAARKVRRGALVLEVGLAPWLADARRRLPEQARLALAEDGLVLARAGDTGANAISAEASSPPFTLELAITPLHPSWQGLLPIAGAGLAALLGLALLIGRRLARRADADTVMAATPAKPTASQGGAQAAPGAGADEEPVVPPSSPAPAARPEPEPPGGPALPEAWFQGPRLEGSPDQPLEAEHATLLGQAIGSQAGEQNQPVMVVAQGPSTAAEALAPALIQGLKASGRQLVDLGVVPRPLFEYAVQVLDSHSGVYVDQGLEVVIRGERLHGETLAALRQRLIDDRLDHGRGDSGEPQDLTGRYLRDIGDDIVLGRPLTVAVAAEHAGVQELAGRLFDELGCKVVPAGTAGADLGVTLSADGSRLGVLTGAGEPVADDKVLLRFAEDLLSRNPGTDVLFDVECGQALSERVRALGGRPTIHEDAHEPLSAHLKRSGAPLAGDGAGSVCFADRWFGSEDGLYAAARLLEILSLQDDLQNSWRE